MLIEINFGILNLFRVSSGPHTKMSEKCLSKQRPWRGSSRKCLQTQLLGSTGSFCQPTDGQAQQPLQISTQLLLAPRHQRSSPSPERRRLLYATMPGEPTAGSAHLRSACTPPAAGWCWTCPLQEWRTLRTLWTFQILGLERRKSISSSDFLAVLQRYWLSDWNCWEEERCSREHQTQRDSWRSATTSSAIAICATAEILWKPSVIKLWYVRYDITYSTVEVNISKMTSSGKKKTFNLESNTV